MRAITTAELPARARGKRGLAAHTAAADDFVAAAVEFLTENDDADAAGDNLPDVILPTLVKPSKDAAETAARNIVWRRLDARGVKRDFGVAVVTEASETDTGWGFPEGCVVAVTRR